MDHVVAKIGGGVPFVGNGAVLMLTADTLVARNGQPQAHSSNTPSRSSCRSSLRYAENNDHAGGWELRSSGILRPPFEEKNNLSDQTDRLTAHKPPEPGWPATHAAPPANLVG
jgi:hypothetical protein